MPCLPPGYVPNPGTEPRSPILQVDFSPSEPPGKPKNTGVGRLSLLQRNFPTQDLHWLGLKLFIVSLHPEVFFLSFLCVGPTMIEKH